MKGFPEDFCFLSFHNKCNNDCKAKSKPTKVKHPCCVDLEENNMTGVGYLIIIDSIILSALVTSENEKHKGPTQHSILHRVDSGWTSQEQNLANNTGSTEQHGFMFAAQNDIEKEYSHTGDITSHILLHYQGLLKV